MIPQHRQSAEQCSSAIGAVGSQKRPRTALAPGVAAQISTATAETTAAEEGRPPSTRTRAKAHIPFHKQPQRLHEIPGRCRRHAQRSVRAR